MNKENKLLKGKNGIITGGFHGIGKAIAEECAENKANILLIGKSKKKENATFLKKLREQNVIVEELYCDLSHKDSIDEIIKKANSIFTNIDFLVNNAGTITRGNFLEISREEYDHITNVNLRTPFILTQEVAKLMIQKSIKGSILNISSISAFRSSKNIAHYEVSKAGLNMLTKTSAFSLAEYGIRVNEIAPGLTATEGNSDQWRDNKRIWEKRVEPIPLNREGTPEDFKSVALFLLSSKSEWITGSTIVVDGGLLTRF